jgi:hypothetical protein
MAKLVSCEEVPLSKIPKVGETMDVRMEIPEEAFEPLSAVDLEQRLMCRGLGQK